eukprot:1178079-Prorocentrum_minimum.AAC.1
MFTRCVTCKSITTLLRFTGPAAPMTARALSTPRNILYKRELLGLRDLQVAHQLGAHKIADQLGPVARVRLRVHLVGAPVHKIRRVVVDPRVQIPRGVVQLVPELQPLRLKGPTTRCKKVNKRDSFM